MNEAIQYVEKTITGLNEKIATTEAELTELKKQVATATEVLQIHKDTSMDIQRSNINAGFLGILNANKEAADATEVSMTKAKLNESLTRLGEHQQAYSDYDASQYKINIALNAIDEAKAKATVQLNNSTVSQEVTNPEPVQQTENHFFNIPAMQAEPAAESLEEEKAEAKALATTEVALDSINPMLFGNNESKTEMDIFDGLINPFSNALDEAKQDDPFAELHSLDNTSAQPVITQEKEHRGQRVVYVEPAIFRNTTLTEESRGLGRAA